VNTTSTCVLPAGTVAGENAQLDKAGRPLHAKLGALLIAGVAVKVKCCVPDCPALTVIEGGEGARGETRFDKGKGSGTLVAPLELVSPAWAGVMVQVPAPMRWTVAPDTLHAPPAANVTARPEDAVALTLKSGSPTILLGSAAKVMVWAALAMVNDCGTS